MISFPIYSSSIVFLILFRPDGMLLDSYRYPRFGLTYMGCYRHIDTFVFCWERGHTFGFWSAIIILRYLTAILTISITSSIRIRNILLINTCFNHSRFHIFQHPKESDFPRRVGFCEFIKDRFIRNWGFNWSNFIYWSDTSR